MYDRKVIFAVANRLAKTMSRSEALKTAWALSKGQQAAVVGVTAGKRQQALEHLTRYAAADTDITVKGKDMAVYVGAQGSGCYMVGYLSRQAAAIVRLIQNFYRFNGYACGYLTKYRDFNAFTLKGFLRICFAFIGFAIGWFFFHRYIST